MDLVLILLLLQLSLWAARVYFEALPIESFQRHVFYVKDSPATANILITEGSLAKSETEANTEQARTHCKLYLQYKEINMPIRSE